MKKIVPCLWFDGKAEEAVRFYAKVFKKSKIGKVTYYDDASSEVSGQKKGSILTIEFSLNGQDFLALNGGPIFKFTEALSLMVMCDDQKEVDYYWKALTKGGEEQPCGWLKDKYGLSWQVVPKDWSKILFDKDPLKAEAAMRAMLEMKKLDVRKIEAAKKSVAPKRSAEKPKKRAAKSKR